VAQVGREEGHDTAVEPRFVQAGDPLTFDFSAEYQWNPVESRYSRTFMPYRHFARPFEIEPYLRDLDRRYGIYVANERAAGGAPAVTVSVPSLAGQFDQANVVLKRLTSYGSLPAFYNVELDHVSVVNVDDNDYLPVFFPSGPDKPGHVVGSRCIVSSVLDFGETLPPLLHGSSQPLAKVRQYDFKLSISGPSANFGISCQLVNDHAPSRFASGAAGAKRDQHGAFLPVLDPHRFSFQRFMDNQANLGDLLEEGLGLMPESIFEFLQLRPSADLRTINLDLVLNFPNMQIDDAQFIRFLNAVAHCADWIHGSL